MKYLLIALALTLAVLGLQAAADAATGARTPAGIAQFSTISTSTKRACTPGTIVIDSKFMYYCYAANKFKRYSGAAF